MKVEYVIEREGGPDWERTSDLPFVPPIGMIMEFSNPTDSNNPLWLRVKFVVWEEAQTILHVHLEDHDGMISGENVEWLRKYGFVPYKP